MKLATQHLVSIVETTGLEIDATLLVDGVVITGTLTPIRNYFDWFQEQAASALQRATGIDVNLSPDTTAMEEPWGRGVDEESSAETPEPLYQYFAIRNAEVQANVPMQWKTHPFLLIDATHVGAITAGTFK